MKLGDPLLYVNLYLYVTEFFSSYKDTQARLYVCVKVVNNCSQVVTRTKTIQGPLHANVLH